MLRKPRCVRVDISPSVGNPVIVHEVIPERSPDVVGVFRHLARSISARGCPEDPGALGHLLGDRADSALEPGTIDHFRKAAPAIVNEKQVVSLEVAAEQEEGASPRRDGAAARAAEVHENRALGRTGVRVLVELEANADASARMVAVQRDVNAASDRPREGARWAFDGYGGLIRG